MDNTDTRTLDGGFSMRRTFLTLLGGFAAFAILTASYATADLPSQDVLETTNVVAVE